LYSEANRGMASCSNSFALSRSSATSRRVNRKGSFLFLNISDRWAGAGQGGRQCPSEDAAVQPCSKVNAFNHQFLQSHIIREIQVHLGHRRRCQVDRIGR